MKQSRSLVEGAVSIALFICLLIITFYLPIIGVITLWFLATPIMYYSSRNGLKMGIVAIVVCLCVAFFLTNVFSMLFSAFFLIQALVMGTLVNKKKSAFAVLLGGSLANISMFLLAYAISIGLFHFDPVEALEKTMLSTMGTAEKVYQSINIDTSESTKLLVESIKRLSQMTPFFIVMTSVVYAFITQFLSGLIIKRLRVDYPKFPPFRLWKFPKSLIWYFLILLVISLVGNIEPNSSLYLVVVNGLLILDVVVVIQGLSLIFNIAHRKEWPIVIPILILIVSLLVPYLLQIIRLLGIIDLGFDIRNRIKKKK
ncbi:DUF2232 domain-containing protein [Terrilactibacillus sp. BCM23-1]|uniref:DUF2232 domain-containing protein n=1 Tax=Terrilactibacillus tamarindi TaxID=2599694 RepID=A0A6N8CM38_9BACI|nr:YybS family protein [Terrilactibacillus tamarindi]MTT31074.1 DUF2232 domain-containing protein [Terrilactibacillus tamarindi]